jgi:aryl-alcohol dehydrogenase-like predicted oxidoreductase
VPIELRQLGRTGVDVAILGYGAMELRGRPPGKAIDDAAAGAILNAALDGGVTLIDTSIDYGRSEELIGTYLHGRRDEYFLASKCGCPLGPPEPGTQPPYAHDYHPENIRAGIEQSLRRLRTDRLDLVQLHMSPSVGQLHASGSLETLTQLRDEGKVRFLGMSGALPELPDQIGSGVFDVFQIPYSVVRREHEDLIGAAAAAGAGTIIRGSTARGALTSVSPAGELTGAKRTGGMSTAEALERWQSAGLEDLLDGMTRHEFGLRFALSHPQVSVALSGTADIDHLRANLAIAEKGALPPEIYQRAATLLTARS